MMTKEQEDKFLMTGIVAFDSIKAEEPRPRPTNFFAGGMAVVIGFLSEHPKIKPAELTDLAKARFSGNHRD